MRLAQRAAPAAVLFLFAAAAAAAAPVDDLVARVRKHYADVTGLRADFVQTTHLVAAGMEQTFEGKVLFKKGGKMRWSYEGQDPQVIVSDGTTLWIHQMRDRTVLVQDLGAVRPSQRIALDLLEGFQGLEENFRVEACGAECLRLTPLEANPEMAAMRVELGPDGGVMSVTSEDYLGNRTRVEFRNVEPAGEIPDSAFRFEAPEGVQVLEMPGGLQ